MRDRERGEFKQAVVERRLGEGGITGSCAMKHGLRHHIQKIQTERVFVFIRK